MIGIVFTEFDFHERWREFKRAFLGNDTFFDTNE